MTDIAPRRLWRLLLLPVVRTAMSFVQHCKDYPHQPGSRTFGSKLRVMPAAGRLELLKETRRYVSRSRAPPRCLLARLQQSPCQLVHSLQSLNTLAKRSRPTRHCSVLNLTALHGRRTPDGDEPAATHNGYRAFESRRFVQSYPIAGFSLDSATALWAFVRQHGDPDRLT